MLSLGSLDDHITSCLHEVIAKEQKANNNPNVWDSGKLGPTDCHFDNSTNVGQVLLEPDKLGVSNQDFICIGVKGGSTDGGSEGKGGGGL